MVGPGRHLGGTGILERDGAMIARVEFEFADYRPSADSPAFDAGYLKVLSWHLPIDPDVKMRLENASGYELVIGSENEGRRLDIVTCVRQRDHREPPWIPVRLGRFR